MSETSDLLSEGRKAFERCRDHMRDNHKTGLEDLRFSRLADQWPEAIKKRREQQQRPCLTINKMPSFIRQVVNDSRQNKPSVSVHPIDNQADIETADVFAGIIRNIESVSNADVAYDTGVEQAVSSGFGYWRVNIDYAYDDAFDLDIRIDRVINQFAVFGDPHSTAADSSDWDECFVTDLLSKAQFKRKYAGKADVNFDSSEGWSNCGDPWLTEDGVLIAEWWRREEVEKEIVQLSDGRVFAVDELESNPDLQTGIDTGTVTIKRRRMIKSKRVTQTIMSGADILQEPKEFPGCYIPIVPVYGDEIDVEGSRYFRSLINGAKDAQRIFNYWRPLALDTPIATPSGWTTMGEIAPGDFVFDENGSPTEVVGESPVHINRECFRVTFDDGTSIVADKAHPWPVEDRVARKAGGYAWEDKVVETGDLVSRKHFIKTPRPLDLPDAELPINPYVLGVWLGDGASAGARISQHRNDIEELRSAVRDCGHEVGDACHYENRVSSFAIRDFTHRLRGVGLIGNKHIPASYLRGSRRQREMLLQGLMDTDGSISRNGQCSFTTTTAAIASGFAELLRSLGIKAVSCRREGRVRFWADGRDASEHAPAVQFSFTPSSSDNVFRLSRKSSVQKRERKEHPRRAKRYSIKSVVPVPSVPVKCIAVAAKSHLFLAGEGMVPTHNTTSTELVALAPKVPFIGPKGAFDSDAERWNTANTDSHSYLEYDGATPPQRQPLDVGPAAGALQEAMNASDDMKAIIGIYDASLGARSNETSGRAIMARQREGDVATFHFIDNLSRAIRHTGRILIGIIPAVYSGERIMRLIGEDGRSEERQVNAPYPKMDENGQPLTQEAVDEQGRPQMDEQGQKVMRVVMAMHDLSVGKYDVTVKSGPSFTSRREEAAMQMTEFVRSYPAAAPVMADLMAENFDWPGADKIAERFAAMNPANKQQQLPPELQKQIQEGQKVIKDLTAKVQQLEADKSIDQFNADTKRMQVEGEIQNDQIDTIGNLAIKREQAMASAAQRLPVGQYDPTRQG